MYVITGATGNTGSVVATTLLAKGEKVRVIGRNAGRLQTLAKEGAELFVCDLSDAAALGNAFTGAKAVYAMIPANMASPDVNAERERVGGSIAAALGKAGVKHAVSLSSVGADKTEGTGPVVGLHRFEQKLNGVPGLNVLHLRAGGFMENILGQVGMIQTAGFTGEALRPELKFPMIATRDIGVAAAHALLRLDFHRQQTRELLGQRDISMAEATAIMGKAIGSPGLKYVQLPDEQLRKIFIQFGMSPDLARLLLEMSAAMNSGYMKALEKRSPQNTTPTSFEEFVATEFVPRYQEAVKAA